jgi:methylated-DNA-[protein]-cysteine S-methyltransferase
MTKKVINCKTPIGNFFMILEEDIVIKSGFGKSKYNLPEINNHPYKKIIDQYFAGKIKTLSKIKYTQSSTEFTNKVWNAISQIPYGKTISYKDLAKNADKPKAIRASASACGKNKIALIIPCHRVVRSDGTIGEYLYSPKIKQFLLKFEASQ